MINDLNKIGIIHGDHLAVATSLKNIGLVKGGADTVIDALLEAVGNEGTLMMNTYTNSFPIYAMKDDYIYSQSSKCITGLIPETMRKRPNAIRSEHPVCSVVAIGKEAKYLTKNHGPLSDLYTPYSRLSQINGKFLSIGIGNNLVAIRHEAQRIAGLFNQIPIVSGTKYLNPENNVNLYIYNDVPCVKNLPTLVPTMKQKGIIKTGRIGNAYSTIGQAKELLAFMSEQLKLNPTLTLCNDINCLWCREIERKLNLYKTIKNPHFFQKNTLIKTVIRLINKNKLRKFKYLHTKTNSTNKLSHFPMKWLLDEIHETLYFLIIDYSRKIESLLKA